MMEIVGETMSIAKKEMAKVYRFNSCKRHHVARCFPEGKSVVVSFFAKSLFSKESLRIIIEGPFCSQTKDFKITNSWLRYDISIQNDLSLTPLNVYFISMLAVKPSSDIAIAFFQIEKRICCSSPIPPDCPLPSIIEKRKNGVLKGATRNVEVVKARGLIIYSQSATAIIAAQPISRTKQIMDDRFHTFYSFWSDKDDIELSVGISGNHDAKFVLRVKKDNNIEFIESNIIGGHQVFHICTIFDKNHVCVMIDGNIAITYILDRTVVFNDTYLGCTHDGNHNSLDGYIKSFRAFDVPLIYPRILELYRQACPEKADQTVDFILNYFNHALNSLSGSPKLDECNNMLTTQINEVGFSYLVKQLDFAIPKIFEQFAPNKPFIEDDIRDYVLALLSGPSSSVGREVYSNIGRTDLTIEYVPVKGMERSATDAKIYHLEFKIWGRRGHKSAPSQPLKYMRENEEVGIFVMIDRRVTPKFEDFRNIVKSNADYPCIAISEIRILESNLRYFVSFHDDQRYHTPRMMINIFLPIAE